MSVITCQLCDWEYEVTEFDAYQDLNEEAMNHYRSHNIFEWIVEAQDLKYELDRLKGNLK